MKFLKIFHKDQLINKDLRYWWQLKYIEKENNEEDLILINSIFEELEELQVKDIIEMLEQEELHNKVFKNNEDNHFENKLITLFKNADDAKSQLDYKKAIKFYDQIITLRPSSISYHYERGYCKYMMDDYEEAIHDLTFEISLNNKKYGNSIRNEVFGLRGIYKFNLENYEEAILDLNQRISFKPYDEHPYFFNGACNYYLGDYENGIKNLSIVISLRPDYMSCHKLRGMCQFELKEYDNAYKDFQKAIQIDENDDFSKIKIIQIKKTKEIYDEEIEKLRILEK